jgi:hypothetical protein
MEGRENLSGGEVELLAVCESGAGKKFQQSGLDRDVAMPSQP